jgi:seryl-tRNA synthetase
MIDIRDIQQRPEAYRKAIANKNLSAQVDLDRLLTLAEQRSVLLQSSESLRAERNRISGEIPKLPGDQKAEAIAQVREIKARLAEEETQLEAVLADYKHLMLRVPMVPADDVPVGATDADNQFVRAWGEPRTFDFEPLDHEALGERLGILDKPRATKFAGGRSYLLMGAGALLELAVMRFALDTVIKDGFTPVLGPLMVDTVALEGTGFLPFNEDSVYRLEADDKWLVGTSEVHLVSVHADEILEEASLPILYAGHSACFRREAGSYGRDARGVYRVHQFSKVEQVIICRADAAESAALHARLLANSERILQALGLPYRVMEVCTGDMGQGKVRMHDIETWMPSRNAYGETHSCSSLHDFQARRLGLRYRDADGRTQHAYTLNNTAIASPRILIPILEHYQNADGSVTVPEVLRPYMNGLERIVPRT